MNKEKEIQEMAMLVLCEGCDYEYECKDFSLSRLKCCDSGAVNMVKKLYNAGYRKADEVRKEAAKEIFTKLNNHFIEQTAYACDCTQHSGYYDYSIKVGDVIEGLKELFKEYGVEVK